MTRATRPALTARKADKHALYQMAVQLPEADTRFFERVYSKLRGKPPRTLREDFGGTGYLSGYWVSRGRDREAWVVDIDPRPLAWGEKHVRAPLGRAAARLHYLRADARTVRTPACDVVVAMNFSFFCFKERSVLIDYFRHVHRRLAKGGMLFLDAFGGPESIDELVETRRMKGFTYVWEQAKVNPILSELEAFIHFRFPDGTEMRRAFRYDWRIWTVQEIRECLREAGFRHAKVFWETTDSKGDGTGHYRETERTTACESFVCCLVAHD